MNPEIQQLKDKITALEQKLVELEKKQIQIVRPFNGTNVYVNIDGIRRKIATLVS